MKTTATLISYPSSQTISALTRKSRQSKSYDGGSKIYRHPWAVDFSKIEGLAKLLSTEACKSLIEQFIETHSEDAKKTFHYSMNTKKWWRFSMASLGPNEKQIGTYTSNRTTLSEGYEGELSGREAWWRSYMRETPIPGAYDLEKQSWIYEIEQKPNTYRFKSDGRKIDPHPNGKGTELLPGAYEHRDFLDRFEKIPATYGFKTAERDKYDVMNFGKKDKDVNVSPNAYAVEKYASLTVERLPSKHSMFKSQAKRFPTLQFKPRVPGPGMYEKTFQSSLNGVLQKMGRQHGLFFSSAFQYD